MNAVRQCNSHRTPGIITAGPSAPRSSLSLEVGLAGDRRRSRGGIEPTCSAKCLRHWIVFGGVKSSALKDALTLRAAPATPRPPPKRRDGVYLAGAPALWTARSAAA